MEVNCDINEVEIKEAIALWFQQRHGILNISTDKIEIFYGQNSSFDSSEPGIYASIICSDEILKNVTRPWETHSARIKNVQLDVE